MHLEVEPCQVEEAARIQEVEACLEETWHLEEEACGAWVVWGAWGELLVDQVAGVACLLVVVQVVACTRLLEHLPSCWEEVGPEQWWGQGWEERQQTVDEVCQPGTEDSELRATSPLLTRVSHPWSPS